MKQRQDGLLIPPFLVVAFLGTDHPIFMDWPMGKRIPNGKYVPPEQARRFIRGRASRYWERWTGLRMPTDDKV